MKWALLLILGVSAGTVQAACEDMYLWARLLQPGVCTPRTEFERREIARDKEFEREAAINENLRETAYRNLVRATLARVYGVSPSAVTVDRQNMYSINYGQYVCQDSDFGDLSCLDTGGNYSKGLSQKQLKAISARTLEAEINDKGQLVATDSGKPFHKKKRK